jgi:hypothetical protein
MDDIQYWGIIMTILATAKIGVQGPVQSVFHSFCLNLCQTLIFTPILKTNSTVRFIKTIFSSGPCVVLYLFFYIADLKHWVAESSGFVTAFVVTIFAVSWVYTNARRRGMGRIRAGFFGMLTFIPPFAGIIFFLFRPKKLVVTSLAPKTSYPFPVPVGDQPFILFRVPLRFLMKFVLWLMGLAFLIIGVLSMLGEI